MDKSEKRRTRRTAPAERPATEQEVQILYTPAKPFNRRWFLLRLVTVMAVVLAIFFGMSIFFEVQEVSVAGADKYTEWEIFEASGIQKGEALLGLNRARVCAKIRTALPYVGDVRIGIKLPNTVIIEIAELQAVYAIEDVDGNWWLMDADGRLVDTTDAAAAMDYTRIVGIKIVDAAIGKQAKAYEPPVDPDAPSTTVPASRYLAVAEQLLSALEANGVMDKIDTVNPTVLNKLTVWYGEQYEVNLGTAENLVYKVAAMKAAVAELGEYKTGYLDASFSQWPDQVRFEPF